MRSKKKAYKKASLQEKNLPLLYIKKSKPYMHKDFDTTE